MYIHCNSLRVLTNPDFSHAKGKKKHAVSAKIHKILSFYPHIFIENGNT
jgi:hypothetical protein